MSPPTRPRPHNLIVCALLTALTLAAYGRVWSLGFVNFVDPLHVESVAWISERKDVLSTLLWMLTLAAYLRHVAAPSPRRYAAVVTVFGLALLAKPMVVTLPLVLLLLDFWPLGRWKEIAP